MRLTGMAAAASNVDAMRRIHPPCRVNATTTQPLCNAASVSRLYRARKVASSNSAITTRLCCRDATYFAVFHRLYIFANPSDRILCTVLDDRRVGRGLISAEPWTD